MSSSRTRARWGGVAVVLAVSAGLLLAAPGARAASTMPAPTAFPPPAEGLRGHALWDSYYELEPFRYEEQEWFVSGTARDLAGVEAGFVTRMIVTRPSDPARFNGRVLLDWTNVTAQFENAVDVMESRQMLMREGWAYVHVSAQAAGVDGTPLTPKRWDPVRYAPLSHPGDAFAEDIFAQVASAVRGRLAPGSADPMAGYGVDLVVAAGQSQSGGRLYRYVNQYLVAHPEAGDLVDAFLIHGSASGTKGFGRAIDVKVLHLLSDAEANPSGITPESAESYRLWEIAGTAHSDFFIGYQSVFGHGPRVLAGAPKIDENGYRDLIEEAGNYGERLHPMLATCVVAGSTMPMHYAASAAIQRLADWAEGGADPGNGPRFEFVDGTLARDELGNAKGGIRLPPIDVPLASYRSTQCPLGGVTVPMSEPEIWQRYETFERYRSQMEARTDQAVLDGWLLPDDAVDLMRRVCGAQVRWPQATGACPVYEPPTLGPPDEEPDPSGRRPECSRSPQTARDCRRP